MVSCKLTRTICFQTVKSKTGHILPFPEILDKNCIDPVSLNKSDYINRKSSINTTKRISDSTNTFRVDMKEDINFQLPSQSQDKKTHMSYIILLFCRIYNVQYIVCIVVSRNQICWRSTKKHKYYWFQWMNCLNRL